MYTRAVIGIDEVGRGPIAGPVCVAAFLIHEPSDVKREIKKILRDQKLSLRDSKKLSAKDREAWVRIVKVWQQEGKCDFSISLISSVTIDDIGIAPAIKKALSRSLTRVASRFASANNALPTVLLDGGLKAPVVFKKQKTIIKGDEKEIAIALASIVAKVHRDRQMRRLSQKHPEYGFENHMGYGTAAHYKALRTHGLLDVHRKSFLTRFKAK